MAPLLTPETALLAYGLAHLGLLAGIVLVVLRPFAPGTLVAGVTTVCYAGYTYAMTRTLSPATLWPVGVVLALMLVSYFASSWSERLGIRYVSVQPPIILGAFLGLVVGAIFLGGGMLGQLLGLVLGSFVAGFGQSRTGWRGALRAGPATLYAALGPRALDLLLALTVADLALKYILHRVGVLQTPFL